MSQQAANPLPLQRKIPAILLIDDDEVDVMGVQREFRRSDSPNPIIVARDGVEALQKLRDGSVPHPRMILLDLNMPKMNGIEFLTEARKDPELKKSVIFVLTTSEDKYDKDKAYEQNIAGYLVKGRGNGGFLNVVELLDTYSRVVELP